MKKQLLFLANATEVERFHTDRTHLRQNIGDHSFGVAWGCWLLHETHRPSADLLMAALAHDIGEHVVGDVPSPTKRALGLRAMLHDFEGAAVRKVMSDIHGHLTEEENFILGMADRLDGLMFCYRELRMGNRRILGAYHNFVSYSMAEYKNATTHQVEVFMAAIELCQEYV